MTDAAPLETDAFSTGTLREAAARAVEADTLRSVARRIGVSPWGLRLFIHDRDREPYPKTRRKLVIWYVREGRSAAETLPPGAARTAAAVLVSCLPPEDQEGARGELAGFLRDLYRRRGEVLPGWIGEVGE